MPRCLALVVVALCAGGSLAAGSTTGPDALRGAPDWMRNGPPRDAAGKRLFHSIGTSGATVRPVQSTAPPGWLAYAEALYNLAVALDDDAEALAKRYPEPGAGPPPPPGAEPGPNLRTSLGEVALAMTGRTDETGASAAVAIAFRDFRLDRLDRASLAGAAWEDSTTGSLEFGATGTAALRAELARLGIQMQDSWTAADGTVHVWLAAEADGGEIASAQDPLPGPAISALRAEPLEGRLRVSAAIEGTDLFAPTLFWRTAGAARFAAAGLSRSAGRWSATVPVSPGAVEYFIEAWDRQGQRVSRSGPGWNPPDAARSPVGSPELVVPHNHDAAPTALAFSSDGALLASASGVERRVVVWDVEARLQLASFALPGDVFLLREIAFSPGRSRLAISVGGSVLVYAVPGAALIERLSCPNKGTLRPVRFLSEDELLCAGDGHQERSLRQRLGAGPLPGRGDEAEQGVTARKLADGATALSAGGREFTWRAPLDSVRIDATRSVLAAKFGDALAVFSADGSAPWVATRAASSRGAALINEDVGLGPWQLSPDGRFLANQRRDSSGLTGVAVEVWRIGQPTPILTFAKDSDLFLGGFAFGPGGLFAIAIRSGSLSPWEFQLYRLPARAPIATLRAHTVATGVVAFEGGKLVVSDAGIRDDLLVDLATGRVAPSDPSWKKRLPTADGATVVLQRLKDYLVTHPGSAQPPTVLQPEGNVAAISEDGQRILGTIGGANFELLDARTGRRVSAWAPSSPGGTNWGTRISRDGAVVAARISWWSSASTQRFAVEVFETTTGKLLASIATSSRVGFDLSPDGQRIATLDSEGVLRLWSATSGEPLLAPVALRGVRDGRESRLVRFSPDGAVLAAAMGTGAPTLLEGRTLAVLRRLPDHGAMVHFACFSADGRLLAVSSGDSIGLYRTADGEPLARIIFPTVDEAVVVAPDGHYISGKQASRWMGFRWGGRAIPFGQLDVQLNRPDLVLARIGVAPPPLLEAFARAYHKRVRKLGLVEAAMRPDAELPVIALRRLPPRTTSETLRLAFSARSGSAKLQRLHVEVNDVPAFGSQGRPLAVSLSAAEEVEVRLVPGENVVRLTVQDDGGVESLPVEGRVVFEPPPGADLRADVYVVAVGVSAYADAEYSLRYAAKDAADVAAHFRALTAEFREAHVQLLLDHDATRERILAARDALRAARPQDVVVVFFAGHGLLDDRFDYWFATSDIDFNAPSARGLPFDAIEDLIDGIPAMRKFVLVDTCNSGELDRDEVRVAQAPAASGPLRVRAVRGLAIKSSNLSAYRDLFANQFADLRRGTGALILTSASGLEYAIESEELRNGAFTFALLEGLRSGVQRRNGKVWWTQVRDYVIPKVRELTKGLQTPTARRDAQRFDRALY